MKEYLSVILFENSLNTHLTELKIDRRRKEKNLCCHIFSQRCIVMVRVITRRWKQVAGLITFSIKEVACIMNHHWPSKVQVYKRWSLKRFKIHSKIHSKSLHHNFSKHILEPIDQSFVPLLALQGPTPNTLLPHSLYTLPTHLTLVPMSALFCPTHNEKLKYLSGMLRVIISQKYLFNTLPLRSVLCKSHSWKINNVWI